MVHIATTFQSLLLEAGAGSPQQRLLLTGGIRSGHLLDGHTPFLCVLVVATLKWARTHRHYRQWPRHN